MERPRTKIFATMMLSVCALAVAVALIFLCIPMAEPLEPAYAEGDYDPDTKIAICVTSNEGDNFTPNDKVAAWGIFYYGLGLGLTEDTQLH